MTSRAAPALLLVMATALSGCRNAPPPSAEGPPPASTEAYVSPLTAEDYPWPREADAYEPLAARFPPPEGFERVPVTVRIGDCCEAFLRKVTVNLTDLAGVRPG